MSTYALMNNPAPLICNNCGESLKDGDAVAILRLPNGSTVPVHYKNGAINCSKKTPMPAPVRQTMDSSGSCGCCDSNCICFCCCPLSSDASCCSLLGKCIIASCKGLGYLCTGCCKVLEGCCQGGCSGGCLC
jgi:hypothetical protein